MQCTGVSSPEDCLTKVTCSDQYVSLYFLVFLLNFDLKVEKKSKYMKRSQKVGMFNNVKHRHLIDMQSHFIGLIQKVF